MVLTSTCLFAQSGSKLLYQGQYTETEHRWPAGNTMMAMKERKEILIYEDRLEIYNVLSNGTDWSWKSIIPFKSIQNGRRVYKQSGGFIDVTAVVDANFNISCSDTGGGTFQYVKDGSSSSIPQGGNYGGGNNGGYNNNGGNSGNKSGSSVNPVQPHQVTSTCLSCGGSGKCKTCNGRHWYYGYTGNQITCPNCKPDGACTHCGGSGKITKTEYY